MLEPIPTVQIAAWIATVLSAFTAITSARCAWLSYKLSQTIRQELKSDEKIIASKIVRAGLQNPNHENSVIKCTIFNKSKRKAFISKVLVYDRNNVPMNVTWASRINSYGNPQNPCGLIGIMDTEEIYVRENMGTQIDFCRLEIFHSFNVNPLIAIFDPIKEIADTWD